MYNEYKVVKGIVYCLNCKVKKTPIEKVVEEIQEYGIVGFTGEPIKEKKVCKYCGAKNSSGWLKIFSGGWCCKKRVCRKRYTDEETKEEE